MNKNLISLNELYNVIKKKDLDKFISSYGYSKRRGKKYFVILKFTNKPVHFGAINYEDFLIHKDVLRQDKFKKRFKSLYLKNKDNVNSPIFWSYNLLW